MDDLLSEFLTETSENLSVLDVELVRLEQNPNNPELLSNIFRLVHTIKGTCGFLGLPRLEHVAHASENVLGKFRDGELRVTAQAVSAILESLDTIKGILSVLEQTEAEPPGNDADLIARLNAIAEGREVEAAPAAPPAPHPRRNRLRRPRRSQRVRLLRRPASPNPRRCPRWSRPRKRPRNWWCPNRWRASPRR
jgi:two-component system chemotaxis sensor kinase CheA